MTAPHTKKAPAAQENPLANILVNVILPVLALDKLSVDPAFADDPKLYHIGPTWAVLIGLALPIGYGIWFFIKYKKSNLFSWIGVGSVLLTGSLIFYLWNSDGTIKPNAAQLFGLKEGSIPLVLGVTILLSHWSKTPLLNTFLYSDTIFDIKRIEKEIQLNQKEDQYKKLLFSSTVLFSASFLISTVLNFFLAIHFLGDIDVNAADARTQFTQKVSSIMWWGFLVIGAPILVVLSFLLFRLLKGLRQITGLSNDEITLPR